MKSLPTCTFLNKIGQSPESIDSPLQLKLISFLGLKNYMMQNFIFKRKSPKYLIRKKQNQPQIFTQEQYVPPSGYSLQTKILQTSNHSIPICRLTPKIKTNSKCIIYAHGNASDMADSLNFIERMAMLLHTEYVVFDYTGYGESRVLEVGEQVIKNDLEIVLAWLTEYVKIQNIILWGFSLGTFPVVANASKYKVGGVVLQCPIASINCMFHEQLHPDMKFKQDHFANIDLIGEVHSKILIMHSSSDEIIPFCHAKLLYDKYQLRNGQNRIDFVQVGKIKHNSLHKYIVSDIENDLQKEVFSFLMEVVYDQCVQNSQSSFKTEQFLRTERTQKSKFQNKLSYSQKLPERKLSLKQLEQEKSLKRIRMKIVEGDIENISQDMYQLIVQEEGKSTKGQIIEQKLMNNCFCFSNQI